MIFFSDGGAVPGGATLSQSLPTSTKSVGRSQPRRRSLISSIDTANVSIAPDVFDTTIPTIPSTVTTAAPELPGAVGRPLKTCSFGSSLVPEKLPCEPGRDHPVSLPIVHTQLPASRGACSEAPDRTVGIDRPRFEP